MIRTEQQLRDYIAAPSRTGDAIVNAFRSYIRSTAMRAVIEGLSGDKYLNAEKHLENLFKDQCYSVWLALWPVWSEQFGNSKRSFKDYRIVTYGLSFKLPGCYWSKQDKIVQYGRVGKIIRIKRNAIIVHRGKILNLCHLQSRVDVAGYICALRAIDGQTCGSTFHAAITLF